MRIIIIVSSINFVKYASFEAYVILSKVCDYFENRVSVSLKGYNLFLTRNIMLIKYI